MTDATDDAFIATLPPIYCRRCHGFYAAAEGYCPTCGPPHGDAPPNGSRPEPEPERGPTTWKPIDMTDALDGIEPPAAQLWRRSDGVPLLYRGAMHWFHGESESCKSWAAQLAAAQILNDGGRVLYIDFEDDVRAVVHRLLALAVNGDIIAKRFTYVRPDEPLEDGRGRITAGGVDFARLLGGEFVEATWDLVIVDGVTEAMTVEGLDLGSNADIATWLRRVPVRLATLGAAVVMIDHVTKSREDRGRFAIGGQHKLAGVTGAAYTFTALRPFYRTTTEPVTGTVSVGVVKDRPGHVRRYARDGTIGTLELTAYPDGGVTAALVPADTDPAPELELAIRVLEHLELYDGATTRNIEDGVPGKALTLRSCLKWLAHDDRRWITVEQKGRSHLHWITDEGRVQIGGDES